MQRLEDGTFYDDSILPKKQPGEQLEAGFRCHEFIVNTVKGSSLTLGDFRDKRLWLAFYRYVGCPVCTSHFDEVIARLKQLEQYNISYIAIFDSNSSLIPERIMGASSDRFHVVGNESHGLYDTFGIDNSLIGSLSPASAKAFLKARAAGYEQGKVTGSLTRMPAHFLIESDKSVYAAHYAKNIGDHISWEIAGEFALKAPVAQELSLAVDE